jgi:hypothetical protein
MGAARELDQLDLFTLEQCPPAPEEEDPEDVEPLGSKKWRGRSEVLWRRMASPLQWPDLLGWAETVQWSVWMVRNALAVLEGDGRAEAVELGGVVVWRRRSNE